MVDIGPQYKLYEGQEDTDCVLYEMIQGRTTMTPRGMSENGNPLFHTTRASFAAWAKKRIDQGE